MDLPLDSTGCFSNLSFLWVRKFLIKQDNKNVVNCLESLEHRKKYKIPRTVLSDRADINGKRFIGIYKDEKQTRGKKNGSMLRVAWHFCKTRIIFASIFYAFSTFFALLGPVLFLTLTLDLLEGENLNSNGTLINQNMTSNEVRIRLGVLQLLDLSKFFRRFHIITHICLNFST